MNKTFSFIRVSILILLGCIGTLFIIGEEQDESTLAFIFHLIINKAIGFFLLFVMFCLYTLWHKHDKWISTFDRWCEGITEGEHKPACNSKDNH